MRLAFCLVAGLAFLKKGFQVTAMHKIRLLPVSGWQALAQPVADGILVQGEQGGNILQAIAEMLPDAAGIITPL